jgi:hypothetical protein
MKKWLFLKTRPLNSVICICTVDRQGTEAACYGKFRLLLISFPFGYFTNNQQKSFLVLEYNCFAEEITCTFM